MPETRMTDEEIARASRIWSKYQQAHDLSARKGEMAGIDPVTGEVWLGEWITDIVAERNAKGLTSPLLFERIGYPTALRKGGRRTHLHRDDCLGISGPHQTVRIERIATPKGNGIP